MIRQFLSAAIAIGTIPAAGAQAATPGYYVATPAAAPVKARLITRSTSWHIHDGSYVAARGAERDTILCQLVVRDAGALTAFSAGGTPFDAERLAKCNGKAAAAN